MMVISNRKNFLIDYLKNASVATIRVPREQKFAPERSAQLMQHLLTQFKRLTFLIEAEQDLIRWRILDLWHSVQSGAVLAQAIQSVDPAARVEVSPYAQPPFHQPFYRCLVMYQQAGDFVAPLKEIQASEPLDPLATLVNGMRDLREGERVLHLLQVMGPISEEKRKAAYQRVTRSQIHPLLFLSPQGAGQALGIALSGSPRLPRYQDRDQRILDDRLRHGMLYHAFLMTQLDVQSRAALARISNLASAVLQFSSDFNALRPDPNGGARIVRVDTPDQALSTSAFGTLGAWFDGTDPTFPEVLSVLSIEEMAALWHLPDEGLTAQEIDYLPGGEVPLPAVLARNTEGVCLGFGQFHGKPALARMQAPDRRTHISVIGRTGAGKSTWMEAMIHQDIQAGNGVGVIDPHGKLVADILRYSIPDERIADVVLLEIANEGNPPPLNPLIVQGDNHFVAAGQVVAILDKIYEVKAQRAEDSLTAALATLMQEQAPTVRDVVRLFTDPSFRRGLLDRVRDTVTYEFWEEFERLSPSTQRELAFPVLHRMRHFYRNPALYPILCHPDALDFAGLMRQRKIILLSLGTDERKVPSPERQFLGAVLVSQLQMAVMQNVDSTKPFYLFIDEAQNFVTSSLEQMLSEARKFGLSLCLANQFLGQLQGRVLESVIGNVGATVVFQCGLEDARTLSPYFRPDFSAEDLMNLPLYHAAVKMRQAGRTLPPFTLQTVVPPHPIDIEQAKAREAMIRQRSIQNYTPKTREAVLAWLEARYPQTKSEPADQPDRGGDSYDWSVPESR